MLEIAEPPSLPVHVARPTGNGRGREDLIVHRSPVRRCDTAGRDGILCTSAARTIVDLAPLTGPSELEPILIAADSLRILNRRRLRELVGETPGRRGIRMLRSLLGEEPIRVRSGREIDMVGIARRAGLPDPVVNGRIEGIEVDLHWPALGLVVEVDGWRFHGGRERPNADRDRDQRLVAAGWRVLRFTRDQIADDPEECTRRLAAVALTASREPAGQGRRRRSRLRP